MKHFLYFFSIVLLPLTALAEDAEVNGIKYSLNEEKLTAEAVALCDSTIENLIIPSTIEVEKRIYQVTSVGEKSFMQSDVISVTVSDGITTIGNSAFAGCKALKEVSLPNSVVTIGDWVFFTDICLGKLSIGTGIRQIGHDVFADADYIEDIYIYAPQVPQTTENTYDSPNAHLSGLVKLHVPYSLVEAYQESELPEWRELNDRNIIPLEPSSIRTKRYQGSALRYNLEGRQIQGPQKGVNIIRKSDGSIRKELAK